MREYFEGLVKLIILKLVINYKMTLMTLTINKKIYHYLFKLILPFQFKN